MTDLETKGFTLLELLFALIVLIGISAYGIYLIHPKDYTSLQQNAQRRVDVALISQGLSSYVAQNGSLPSGITNSNQDIGSLTGEIDLCSLVPKYMKYVPVDPLLGKNNKCSSKNTVYISGFLVKRIGNTNNFKVTAIAATKSVSLTN